MQKRSLARHIRNQHPGVIPPRLDLEDIMSPARPMRHVYQIEQAVGMSACPVAECNYEWTTSTQLRRHFLYRHPEDQLHVIGEGEYVKCPSCGKMVKDPISERHIQSKLCRAGALRNATREQQQACTDALSDPFTMLVGGQAIRYVGEFKYLGRVISHDDSDLPACVRNIQRARQKWADLSKLLRQEKAPSELSARFYLVIVSAILLYGSETWVVTKRIEDLLTSFHNRCARTIGKTFIHKRGDDEWVYPSVAETFEKSSGVEEISLVHSFPTLCAQYATLETCQEQPGVNSGCEQNCNQELNSVVE